MDLISVLQRKPQAVAQIRGSKAYPQIRGQVRFYQTRRGVVVRAEVTGLPVYQDACKKGIFGFHIHEGSRCSGSVGDPFADVLAHFGLYDCIHPYHSGDLPPLFGNNGYAFSVFLTDRFAVRDILGRTVIIHGDADDFTTQPSGDAGQKIACGEIRA